MQTDSNIVNFYRELTDRSHTDTLAATVENVRRTCFRLANTPECSVKIDEDLAISYIAELDMEELKRPSHFMKVPIEFRNLQSEVCFHITLHLFNFGHGFRHSLHEVCGLGAWMTMKRGVETLHVMTEQGCIDANTLLSLSESTIDRFFHFPRRGSSIAVNQISLLREMIIAVAQSTGRRLIDLGYKTFAEFIFDHSQTTTQGQPSGLRLVEILADNFPPFDDRRILPEGKEVLFLKKAQIVVAELYQRLGKSYPEYFAFGDIKCVTVACDNVLPCVLRSLGILKLDPVLEQKIDKRDPLPAGLEEAQLRSAAIAATETMLKHGKGDFWAKQLGDYLWTLGKDPKFRQIERHATIDTCFY